VRISHLVVGIVCFALGMAVTDQIRNAEGLNGILMLNAMYRECPHGVAVDVEQGEPFWACIGPTKHSVRLHAPAPPQVSADLPL
jgi:hypothetical protein